MERETASAATSGALDTASAGEAILDMPEMSVPARRVVLQENQGDDEVSRDTEHRTEPVT